jgi:hypothetical protein
MKVTLKIYGAKVEAVGIKIKNGGKFTGAHDALHSKLGEASETKYIGALSVQSKGTDISKTLSAKTADELGAKAVEALGDFIRLLQRTEGFSWDGINADVSCSPGEGEDHKIKESKEAHGAVFTTELVSESLGRPERESILDTVGTAILEFVKSIVPERESIPPSGPLSR